ncbi:MAG: class IV adenylate cyclase [Acidobacteria bacterium]|nr:class IV adenylate cyclase [Acidobacteriota bacterium]
MALEREIKLRFDTADEARARVLELGVTPFKGRRLQEDCLLDDERQSLRKRECVLRVRNEGGKGLLTFKGAGQPGPMKLREEHETVVADGETLLTILAEVGLRVWFRYEKYREEFHFADVIIAVDETPLGTFIEIEGGESHIHQVARELGRAPSDYITDSYHALFLKHREAIGIEGNDMVFAAQL